MAGGRRVWVEALIRTSLRSRTILSLVATLQLVVPGAAAWVDAEVEARGHVAPVHIESHSTSSCARVHPPDCGLCRFLSTPLSTQARQQPGPALVVPRTRGGVGRAVPPAIPRRALPQPRAPPALS